MRVRVADWTVLPAGIVMPFHLRSAGLPPAPSTQRVVAAPKFVLGALLAR